MLTVKGAVLVDLDHRSAEPEIHAKIVRKQPDGPPMIALLLGKLTLQIEPATARGLASMLEDIGVEALGLNSCDICGQTYPNTLSECVCREKLRGMARKVGLRPVDPKDIEALMQAAKACFGRTA